MRSSRSSGASQRRTGLGFVPRRRRPLPRSPSSRASRLRFGGRAWWWWGRRRGAGLSAAARRPLPVRCGSRPTRWPMSPPPTRTRCQVRQPPVNRCRHRDGGSPSGAGDLGAGKVRYLRRQVRAGIALHAGSRRNGQSARCLGPRRGQPVTHQSPTMTARAGAGAAGAPSCPPGVRRVVYRRWRDDRTIEGLRSVRVPDVSPLRGPPRDSPLRDDPPGGPEYQSGITSALSPCRLPLSLSEICT